MAGVKGRSGRKPSPLTQKWREFCRDVVSSSKVRRLMRRKAETDADYALKLAEAAHGRPPQALDIRHAEVPSDQQVIYRAAVAGLDSAEFEGLPGTDVPVESTD